MIAGGLNNNLDFLRDCVSFSASVPEENRALLFDPQTSGGLLVAIAPKRQTPRLKLCNATRSQQPKSAWSAKGPSLLSVS